MDQIKDGALGTENIESVIDNTLLPIVDNFAKADERGNNDGKLDRAEVIAAIGRSVSALFLLAQTLPAAIKEATGRTPEGKPELSRAEFVHVLARTAYEASLQTKDPEVSDLLLVISQEAQGVNRIIDAVIAL